MKSIISKYSNSRFGKIHESRNILLSLGFREEEGGILQLPVDFDLKELESRKLEIEVGLDLLKKQKLQSTKPKASTNKNSNINTLSQNEAATDKKPSNHASDVVL